MKSLFAWSDDALVGRFDLIDVGRASFTYEDGITFPISLSLPLGRQADEVAAYNFLDALLPDGATARVLMQHVRGAASTNPFDLLPGSDSFGGLVFTTRPELSSRAEFAFDRMTDRDFIAQVRRTLHNPDAWWADRPHCRFSLAGNQAKFTYSEVAGRRFWPNADLPSTHIIKPDGDKIVDVSIIETSTMQIARSLGYDVAEIKTISVAGQDTSVVTRFDRYRDDRGFPHRLRAEDLTQALGRTCADKYDIEMKDVTDLFHSLELPERLSYDFVDAVILNSCIGGMDAHAKNYSIFLSGDEVRLCPLYDTISMAHWPGFRYDTLAMGVNDVYDPWEVTLSDWEAQARICGLDPDRVVQKVIDVERALLDYDYSQLPCAAREGHPAIPGQTIADEIALYVRECGRDLIPSIQGRHARAFPQQPRRGCAR